VALFTILTSSSLLQSRDPLKATELATKLHAHSVWYFKERYKEGFLWAGRGTIPVNELAWS